MATTDLSDAALELRRIREALGMNQEQFADRLSVHRTTLAKWETDAQPISETALRLARFYAGRDILPPPPPYLRPSPESTGVFLKPGTRCLWQEVSDCRGRFYNWQAPVGLRRHIATEACEVHGWQAFAAIVAQVRQAAANEES